MNRPLIVFVHGLWLTGSESLILRRRLETALGAETCSFHYSSRTAPMAEVVTALADFVAAQLAARSAAALHFVGHSLGGLVLLRLLERRPQLPPGRVVFLGTPAAGSRAVSAVARFGWAAGLLGACVAEELFEARTRTWTSERQLGVIAGSRPLGLGQFFAHFDEPSDGTIAVAETRLAGARDHLVLPVSHMGMLLSTRVAEECAAFLKDGNFHLGSA